MNLSQEIIDAIPPEFNYLNQEQLNAKFEQSDLEALGEFERKEIKKWNAQTFGEIIFNFWD